MGKRSNYLTLEQASQMLGKPDSFFLSLISKGELGAKLAGGQWQISVRDFDKIRDSLPREPEKIVHKAPRVEQVVYNFLTDSTSQKRVARTKPTAQKSVPSVAKSVPSTSVSKEAEFGRQDYSYSSKPRKVGSTCRWFLPQPRSQINFSITLY